MIGVSFIVKVLNEEQTLDASIQSLVGFLFAYEILIFLNACTDNSTTIAHRLAAADSHIKIFEYNHRLSRPGYETFATHADSDHSLIKYYNHCLKQANYNWVFKWDADFVMNDGLRQYLNTLDLQQSLIIRLGARDLEGSVEMNAYLSSCLVGYAKDNMWEMPGYIAGCPMYEETGVYINHMSSPHYLKKYWFAPGWYTYEQSEEATQVKLRLADLVSEFGTEPVGHARSGNLVAAVQFGQHLIDIKGRAD
jgi:glycosyltransferase involved in cell wall biosynthesis